MLRRRRRSGRGARATGRSAPAPASASLRFIVLRHPWLPPDEEHPPHDPTSSTPTPVARSFVGARLCFAESGVTAAGTGSRGGCARRAARGKRASRNASPRTIPPGFSGSHTARPHARDGDSGASLGDERTEPDCVRRRSSSEMAHCGARKRLVRSRRRLARR